MIQFSRLVVSLLTISSVLCGCTNDSRSSVNRVSPSCFAASIILPPTYIEVTRDNLTELVWKPEDSTYCFQLKEMFKDSCDQIFIDTTDYFRIAHFFSLPYMPVDSNLFYETIQQQEGWTDVHGIGDTSKYKGSRILEFREFKSIESKYFRESHITGRQKHGYSFLVSMDSSSTGILFLSPEEMDAKRYVRTLRKIKN